jgi:hypothetical protein
MGVGRERNEDVDAASPQLDRMVSGLGTLRQVTCAQQDAVTSAGIVQFGVRSGNATNSATSLLNVRVQFVNEASLDVGAHVVLERPGASTLRCVVAQRLSRANRYRLTVLDVEQTTH